MKELPDTDLRCFVLRVSAEDMEDADVEALEVVDEVRCNEEASEEAVDKRDAFSGRLTLYRLGGLYRSIGDLYKESV